MTHTEFFLLKLGIAISIFFCFTNTSNAFDLRSLYYPETVSELLEKRNEDPEEGWFLRKSKLLYDDRENNRNFYYVQAVRHDREQVYMGFMWHNPTTEQWRFTWGIVGDANGILGPLILGVSSQYRVSRIIPGKYCLRGSEYYSYNTEQHPVFVNGYWSYDFTSSGTGSYTFNLASYAPAPLEEAANHYNGGYLGRLTGGYHFWTNGEVKYPFTYFIDRENDMLNISYKGNRIQTTPRSKLDLSESAFANVYESSINALKQQFREDFPTNYYRKEREAGFKKILNEIKVDPLANDRRRVYFNDSTTLVLSNNPYDEYRVESYDIYCSDKIPDKDYYRGLIECIKYGKKLIRYLPDKKSTDNKLSKYDIILLTEFMSSYTHIQDYYDFLPLLFNWIENNFKIKGGKWLDTIMEQNGTAECLKWVYMGFEIKFAISNHLTESTEQSIEYALSKTLEFYHHRKDDIKPKENFIELANLSNDQIKSIIRSDNSIPK